MRETVKNGGMGMALVRKVAILFASLAASTLSVVITFLRVLLTTVPLWWLLGE